MCTYGFLEKRDLRRVVDGLPPGPVVLMGTSLGAAVALQEAAADPRITSVIAAEAFSDLRTVATERAPWFLPPPVVRKAFQVAEQRGGFLVDAVSPMEAARAIRAPVLLIHGADDRETPPAHSQRIFEALAGPRRLLLVPGAGHNQSLNAPAVWVDIERWVEESLELGIGDWRWVVSAGWLLAECQHLLVCFAGPHPRETHGALRLRAPRLQRATARPRRSWSVQLPANSEGGHPHGCQRSLRSRRWLEATGCLDWRP